MESTEKKKYCRFCGTELTGTMKFCTECGSPCAENGGGSPIPDGFAAEPAPKTGLFDGLGMAAYAARHDAPRFELNYSAGMMANSGRTYKASVDGDFVNVRIRMNGVPMINAQAFRQDAAFFDRIEAIVDKYGVRSWDGFDGSDPNVLDGDSFSLSVRMRDRTCIGANGYMAYPAGYRGFCAEIDGLFTELYETRFPNYGRILNDYYEKELMPQLCDLTEGAKIEYGYVSEGGGSFSYGEADLPDGVIAKIIGNFAVDGRERAGRDMAVFYVQKHKLDDRDINGVELYAEFTTVDDEMQIKELGYAKLESNAFWNDRIHARIFTPSAGERFSLGYFSHKQNRFWDKPDTVRLTIFTFDGERISVAFDETVNVDISSVTDRLPTAQDFPELAPYVDALESLGYGATANAWREDISSIDMAQSDVTPHLLIGTFPATNGLYEKLLATPAGETVEGNTVRGFIQPGM